MIDEINSSIESISREINKMNEDLNKVHKSLEAARLKHNTKSKTKDDALIYIEKAEKVIEQAESGKLDLSTEQLERIKETLGKILLIFRST
jgi:chromosome segregation ATPase